MPEGVKNAETCSMEMERKGNAPFSGGIQRNNGSTFVSQAVDSVVFTLIAFIGIYPDLWQLALFTWIIKIIVAILDTPFIYLSRRFKPKELNQ